MQISTWHCWTWPGDVPVWASCQSSLSSREAQEKLFQCKDLLEHLHSDTDLKKENKFKKKDNNFLINNAFHFCQLLMNLFELLFSVQFDLITYSCNPLFLSLTPPAIYVFQNKLYKSFLFRASLMTEIVREVIVLITALKLKYLYPCLH